MSKHLFAALLVTLALSVSAQEQHDDLVWVEGGTFKHPKSIFYGVRQARPPALNKTVTVAGFYIGKYEVTQKEWASVMGDNPSKFKGDNLPVERVSWYDCIEYCNRRSVKEGLKPYYNIDKATKDPHNKTAIDDIKWTVTINTDANGYRLPTEAEWEYAGTGGQLSKGYTYCGGDDIGTVAWYWQNAGDKLLGGYWHWPTIEKNNDRTKPVGGKTPNELGLYDMSGNVREWCWDWYGELDDNRTPPQESTAETGRVWKGGGWVGGDFCCAPTYRSSYEANGKGPDQGLRVCRNK
jgi:formylglycine-generating enzyme required for sulfatase activity